MKVRNTGGDFESPPTGTHLARCIGLIGIGTHKSDYQGKPRLQTQVVITWELPHEMKADNTPHMISAFYTRSLSEKAHLRHALVNWRGRDFSNEELNDFELKNILDKGCQVVISKNDKGKTRVTGVVGLPKGATLPDRTNTLLYFDIEEFIEADFEQLSHWFQEKVKDSFEYREIAKFGRILDYAERLEVDRYGDDALNGTGTEFTGPALPLSGPAVDDDIPF